MSTQAIVRVADAKVANGEATVAVVYLLDKRAVHVVCSCCGTVSTDTYADDASGDEMFTIRWNGNVRANAHARHGTHRAERITCGTCSDNGTAPTEAGESVVAFFARYGIGGA
jgi:hypothetical protein